LFQKFDIKKGLLESVVTADLLALLNIDILDHLEVNNVLLEVNSILQGLHLFEAAEPTS